MEQSWFDYLGGDDIGSVLNVKTAIAGRLTAWDPTVPSVVAQLQEDISSQFQVFVPLLCNWLQIAAKAKADLSNFFYEVNPPKSTDPSRLIDVITKDVELVKRLDDMYIKHFKAYLHTAVVFRDNHPELSKNTLA